MADSRVNASWAYWSSLYDSNNSALSHVLVEESPANSSFELHGLAMPAWLVHAPNRGNHGVGGTLPNLWMMDSCARAVETAETERGSAYAAVVKVRPDSFFWGAASPGINWAVSKIAAAPPCDSCPQLLLSALRSDLNSQASDKYAVGTSAAMRYYLSAWHHADALWQKAEATRRVIFGEHLLYDYMKSAPFKHAPIPKILPPAQPIVHAHTPPRAAAPHAAPHAAPQSRVTPKTPTATPEQHHAAPSNTVRKGPGLCVRHPKVCSKSTVR